MTVAVGTSTLEHRSTDRSPVGFPPWRRRSRRARAAAGHRRGARGRRPRRADELLDDLPLAGAAAHVRRALASSTTARAASAPTRSSGTTRRCRPAPCTRSPTRTGSSRAIASRRSGCCAGCRRARCCTGGGAIRPAGGTRPTTASPRSACRSRRTSRTPPGSRGAKKLKGELDRRDRVLRRRRDERGRVPRRRELRGGDAGAADPLLQQQPVGDLDAARRRRRMPRRSPTRPSATGCRACASTAATCSPCTRRRARRSSARAPASGPTFIEAVTLSRRAARDRRRPARLHRPRARRGGEAQRVPRPLRALSPPARRARRRDLEPRSRRGARRDAAGHHRRRGRAGARSRARVRERLRPPAAEPRARAGMAEKLLVEAVNDALHVELARDDSVMVMGEDVGRAGGVFRATAGLRERFGENRCVDTPLAEAGILGSRGRALHGGLAAGLRDAVRRVLVSVPRPADHARRPLPLAHGREDGVPDRRAHAVRRRRARARAARRLAGGVLRPHARHQGRDPVDAGRREGAARGGDPRSRSRRHPRAEAHLSQRARRGAGGRLRRPARQGAARARGDDVTLVAYGAMVPVCERAADALRGRGLGRGARHALAAAARRGRAARVRGEDGPRRRSCRRRRAPPASAPRSRRSSPRRRSSTSAGPCCASPASTCRIRTGRSRTRTCRRSSGWSMPPGSSSSSEPRLRIWLERGESGFWLRDAATGEAMSWRRSAPASW